MNRVPCNVREAHCAWQELTADSAVRFSAALEDCEGAQRAVLQRLIHRNRNTVFGKRHGFESIRNAEAFSRGVPLSSYEDYGDAIERVARGEPDVLTSDDVLLFEPSSGSASPTKYIPYTASLRHEFQRAVSPWIHALYAQFPAMMDGRAYWSISPALPERPDAWGTIPVGFDHDSAYLHADARRLFQQVALTPDAAGIDDIQTFRTRTMAALLSAPDLAFISVWSPSFLRLLCDAWLEYPEDVLRLCPPQRARQLERLGNARDVFEQAWPGLAAISCWTDAASAQEAERLRDYFPTTPMQGKGLLATEAAVTIPFAADRDPVLAVRSHFFEFAGPGEEVFPAWRVKEGSVYSVVVTTGGGLYRYRLGDQVRVTGRVGTTPTLRFLGRGDAVSDRCGEKLNEAHVAQALDDLLPAHLFSMLAPDASPDGRFYTLYVQSGPFLDGRTEAGLERRLCENPHYAHCVGLGQLLPARIFRVRGDPFSRYESRLAASGVKRGDIKPVRLSRLDGWTRVFEGEYL